MVLRTSIYYASRITSPEISFQGRFTRINVTDLIRCQCQCYQQKRTFINLTNVDRKKEYCGRQLVGFSMDQMYSVVSDVGNYYKFVPWCKQSNILTQKETHLHADLIIGFPPLNESYTSHVTLVKPYMVKAQCIDGRIFNQMLTLWRFSPGLKQEPQSCVVDFQINFEFRSALHSKLSTLFFDQVVRQMEGAFIKEVGRRYGAATLQPRNLLMNKQTVS